MALRKRLEITSVLLRRCSCIRRIMNKNAIYLRQGFPRPGIFVYRQQIHCKFRPLQFQSIEVRPLPDILVGHYFLHIHCRRHRCRLIFPLPFRVKIYCQPGYHYKKCRCRKEAEQCCHTTDNPCASLTLLFLPFYFVRLRIFWRWLLRFSPSAWFRYGFFLPILFFLPVLFFRPVLFFQPVIGCFCFRQPVICHFVLPGRSPAPRFPFLLIHRPPCRPYTFFFLAH